MRIVIKIWHLILDAISWITQDSARLHKAKRNIKPEHLADHMRIRGIFQWR